MSDWDEDLSPAVLRAHERWDAAGRRGAGRLVLEGRNMRGATGAGLGLMAARLRRCDLSRARLRNCDLGEAELDGCVFDHAALRGCGLERAHVTGCRFVKADLSLMDLSGARLSGGDFSDAKAPRTLWQGAHVEGVTFRRACLHDCVFDEGEFLRCDLREADLRWTKEPPIGNAYGARFVECDFRGADLSDLKLKGTVFERCGFHGTAGRPLFEGPCQFIAADLSPGYDGSDVRDTSPWPP